jgi:hypothetical protein
LVNLASKKPLAAKTAFVDSPQFSYRRQIVNYSEIYPLHDPSILRCRSPRVKPVKFPAICLRISRYRDEPVGFERGPNFLEALHRRFIEPQVRFPVRWQSFKYIDLGKTAGPRNVVDLVEIAYQLTKRFRLAVCSGIQTLN